MKKIISLLMVAVMCLLCFAGCRSSEKIVVAEKGSAGETVAKDLEGYSYTAVDTQNKALIEVKSGTADAESSYTTGP